MTKIRPLVYAGILLLTWNNQLQSQCNGVPCQTPEPSVNAQDACILPNPAALDCYNGATGLEAPVSFPPFWCSTVENNHFLAFTADAASASFEICTYNCASGDGIQAAVLSTANCIDFLFVSPCVSIPPGGCESFVATGLIPGAVYYLMLDGVNGDRCDYSINGVDPTIDGPTDGICLPSSALSTYTTNTFSSWTINPPSAGAIQGNPNSSNVNIMWLEAGLAEVCVQSIECPNSPSFCLPVLISEDVETFEMVDVCQGQTVECAGQTFSSGGTFPVTLQTFLGCDSVVNCVVHLTPTAITYEIAPICISGSVMCAGEEFFIPGTYPVSLVTDQGCDSIVNCIVKIVPVYNGPLTFVNLCAPAQYEVCNEFYGTTGVYAQHCTGYLGCDSIVNIDLAVLNPIAHIAPPAALECDTSNTVTLNGTASTLNNATGGITIFAWTGPGIIGPKDQSTVVVNKPGVYCLVVKHGRGGVFCADTACVTVMRAQGPGAVATGGNRTCISAQTTLMGSSPTNGVNFIWTGPGITPANQFLPNPTVMDLGVYILSVTNPVNGCTSTAVVTVNEDLIPPSVTAPADTINCFQISVTIDGVTDASSTSWNWSGPGIHPGNQMVENPNVIQGGAYTVTVTNTVNGCTNTASTLVEVNNNLPGVNAGPNSFLTCSVLNITLLGSGSGFGHPVSFGWTGPNGFIDSIPQPSITIEGEYILTVMDSENGCLNRDTVQIYTDKVLPSAAAGANSTINCVQPAVFLLGGSSSSGPNFTANWTGPGIHPANQHLYDPEVDQAGIYVLLITNSINGCMATDTVLVSLDTILPTVSAGLDQLLTCATPNGVTLNGNGAPGGVTYFWDGPGIGVNNSTLSNPDVTQAGPYNLTVTNPVNGCTAVDQVIVTQNAGVPVANGGPDQVLNCSVTAVNLDGGGSSAGVDIQYNWSGPGITGGNSSVQSPASLIAPGIYSLTVTNTTNNCAATDVVVVGIDTIQPVADAGNALQLNCFNNATGMLDASGSSLGANYSLIWTGNGINATNETMVQPLLNNVSGAYNLTVTNLSNTCTATDQVVVTLELTAPTADAGSDAIIDCVQTAATLGGASSTGANISYQWTGPGINNANALLLNPTVDQPGTYILVVTDNANGCTAANDVLVTSNAVFPIALAGNDGLLTCANPVAILDGSNSSAGANYQVLWSGPGISGSNASLLNPDVTLPGIYVLLITDTQNSCTRSDTLEIQENKTNPVADAGANQVLNCQVLNVILDGSLSSAGPMIVYTWNGPDINGSNQHDQSPVVNQAGMYDLVVTDNENGCSATEQVLVTQDIQAPTASAGADGLITCSQLTETIDGSGSSVGMNITYIWNGSGINSGNFNQQSPTVSINGTYTVTVTNVQNHCTATDMVLVLADKTPPAIAAGPDGLLSCSATAVSLDGSQSASGANISFLWNGPGVAPGTQNSATPTVNLPGLYVLTIMDANNGCTNTASVMVTIDTISPIVFAGSNLAITCVNAASGVMLNSTGSSTGANFEYLWSGPGINTGNATAPNPIVLVPGAYILQIVNTVNGCVNTDEVEVSNQQTLPTADAGPQQVVTCALTQVILDGTGSSAPNGSLSFLWAGPGIDANNEQDDTPAVSLGGTYFLTVTNPITGCSATDQVVVNLDNQPPVLEVFSEVITCLDLVSTIEVISSLAGTSYLWAGPGVPPGSQSNPSIEVDVAGMYTVMVTAPNGCSSTQSEAVLEDTILPQGLVSGTILNCINGGSSQITGEVLSPSGATFNWTGPGLGTVNASVATVTIPGTYTFTMVAPNGCIRPITAEVLGDFEQPEVMLVTSGLIDCNTAEVIIHANGSSSGPEYQLFWSTNNGHFVSGTNTLTPVVDRIGQYRLRIMDSSNGCADSSQVDVLVDPLTPSAIDLTIEHLQCFGDSDGAILVNAVQGGTVPFLFSLNGNPGSANTQYAGLEAGLYALSLLDANGCQLDTIIEIPEPAELHLDLGLDVTVDLGEYATVSAMVATTAGIQSASWNWAPGCTDSTTYCETFTYRPLDSYRHELTVVDSNGCAGRDGVWVIVKKARQVYVPSIFNPNSSENYAVTVFAGNEVKKVNSFFIFDRWGEEVFQSLDFQPNDFSKGWDGRIRGQDGQLGVYVWYCSVEFIDGNTKHFRGDVTLLR